MDFVNCQPWPYSICRPIHVMRPVGTWNLKANGVPKMKNLLGEIIAEAFQVSIFHEHHGHFWLENDGQLKSTSRTGSTATTAAGRLWEDIPGHRPSRSNAPSRRSGALALSGNTGARHEWKVHGTGGKHIVILIWTDLFWGYQSVSCSPFEIEGAKSSLLGTPYVRKIVT